MRKWHYVRLILFVVGILALAHFVAWATIADFDFRERGRTPVAIEVATVTVDYDVDRLVGTTTVTVNGNAEQIVITVPDLNVTNATAIFKLKDENGITLGESPDNGDVSNFFTNTSKVWKPSEDLLLAGTTTLEITTSNAQTEDQSVTVEMYLR